MFVGGFVGELTERDIGDHFSQYGHIQSVRMVTDPQTGQPKGVSFVTYSGREGLERAVEVGAHTIKGLHFEAKRARTGPRRS